jgi:MFS family permease
MVAISAGPLYVFKPHERPTLPGSPANPDHPLRRRVGYFFAATLIGLTGGLGSAFVTVNLPFLQGTLGLSPDDGAWLLAAYYMTNVTANLLLIKYRQQFGLQPFVRYVLLAYALVTFAHLFINDFWSTLAVRAISGLAGSGLSTLTILYFMQGLPAPKRLAGIMLGISVPQIAVPIARVLSPDLLTWDDWRMTYVFEVGLALATLAAVVILPLPPSEQEDAFERQDFLTFGLLGPGLCLVIAVLCQGRLLWWTETPWIGRALVAAIVLITAALLVEHGRRNPLINTRWLGTGAIVRLMLVAAAVRILLSEQSFGSVGFLMVVGMGVEQMMMLNIVVVIASIAGVIVMLATFRPHDVGLPIGIAILMIAVAAFIDANTTNLTRPADFYLTQAMIGFASVLFLGTAMVIGIARTLLAGTQNLVSFVVLFSVSQSIGGLAGSAALGTFQSVREKFHSHELVQRIVPTDPLVAMRVRGGGGMLGGVVTDPDQRSAQGLALLARQVAREANILAFNDVFFIVGVLASVALISTLLIRLSMHRRGEISPIIALQQRMQAPSAEGTAGE